MYLFDFYHQHQLNRFFQSDFWLYEMATWLHVVARSLITVFVPILLLTTGYSLQQVILFYFIYHVIDVPLNLAARHVIERVGARWTIVIATFWTILFFITLSFLVPDSLGLLVVLALLLALYDTFYWVAHIFLFIESTAHDSDAGSKTGILFSVQRLGGLLSPALGAAIILLFGENILIYTSIAFFILSTIPLFHVDDFPDKPTKKRVSFQTFFAHPIEKRNFMTTGLFSVHRIAENIMWPLFIYLTYTSIASVALVPIIVSIGAILFSYSAGKIPEHKRELAITLGAVLIILVWIARFIFDDQLFLFGSVFLVSLFTLLVSIPSNSRIFTRAKYVDPLGTATYRNIAHMFAKAIFLGILLLIVNIFNVSFLIATMSLLAIIALNGWFVMQES